MNKLIKIIHFWGPKMALQDGMSNNLAELGIFWHFYQVNLTGSGLFK